MSLFLIDVGWYAAKALNYYLAAASVWSLLAAAVGVVQEQKIWESKELPSLTLWGKLKVLAYGFFWFLLSCFGPPIIIAKWILTLGASDIARDSNRMVEDFIARNVFHVVVGRVEFKGLENQPPEDLKPAPIYILNHASQIDIAVVYFIGRRFKWIAKKSVIFLPGVGQLLFLGKHVFVDRRKGKNDKNVSNLFEKSNATVQAGIPMLIFPQGTRRIAERLPAKEGAFIIAQTNKSPLVPVSIDIPENAWNSLYPLNLLWGGERPVVKMTMHPVVTVSGSEDREKLKMHCMDTIYSVLPSYEGHKKHK